MLTTDRAAASSVLARLISSTPSRTSSTGTALLSDGAVPMSRRDMSWFCRIPVAPSERVTRGARRGGEGGREVEREGGRVFVREMLRELPPRPRGELETAGPEIGVPSSRREELDWIVCGSEGCRGDKSITDRRSVHVSRDVRRKRG
eukprot:scaffold166794_cov32-Tisochrysis_lutea.AAC.3